MGFSLTSESFRDKGMIPSRYTCDGWDMSPPLFWTEPPPNTKSLVLIVDDPDAPDPVAPLTKTWVHWLLYNIPPETRGLPEGVTTMGLPAGCRQGRNDWGRSGYGGPCPPRGKHRYRHQLYALDIVLPDLKYPVRAVLGKAMAGHVLARTELTGLYERKH